MKRSTNQGRTGRGSAPSGGRSERREGRSDDRAARPERHGAADRSERTGDRRGSAGEGRPRRGDDRARGEGRPERHGGADRSERTGEGRPRRGDAPSRAARGHETGEAPAGARRRDGGPGPARGTRSSEIPRAARRLSEGAGARGRDDEAPRARRSPDGARGRDDRRMSEGAGRSRRDDAEFARKAARTRDAGAPRADSTRPRPGVPRADSTRPRTGAAPARKVRSSTDAPRALSEAPALRKAGRAAAARAAKPTDNPEILRPAKMRLQKALAAAGVTSRRKAEELIEAGKIKVNGKRVTELGTKVDPDRDKIEVNGSRVQLEKKVYFVMNKPDGVVCSAEEKTDPRGRPTVISLLPELPQRVYPVGRLDFHSRGVLILTNDGDLAAALTHPRHQIPKTYHVKFQGKLTDTEYGALAGGVTLDDGTVTRPADEVSVIKETDTNTWVQVTIRQGLNRQLRRMGEAIGRPVLKLIRVAVGPVTADGLDDGEFRPLTPTEVYDLMASATPASAPQGQVPARARSRLARGKLPG